jgi:hypothetical protein
MDEERKEPRPANDNGSCPVSRLTREFRGLQQLGHCDIIALLCPKPKRAARCARQGDDVRLWDAS